MWLGCNIWWSSKVNLKKGKYMHQFGNTELQTFTTQPNTKMPYKLFFLNSDTFLKLILALC